MSFRNLLGSEFSLFLFAGGTAAIVNFLSRIVLNTFCNFKIAVVIAYILGMVTAYVLSRLFVFKDQRKNITTSSIKFILVNIVAVLQTYYISVYLYTYLDNEYNLFCAKEVAHAIGIIVPVITSYFGHKYFSFK